MAASEPPTCHLLRIPRELRDEIYAHCLMNAEGYHHHAETNTLRYRDGMAIDVALLQTCKQVAAEATEYTLSKNTIAFKTHIARIAGVGGVFGPSLQSTMCYFNNYLRCLDIEKSVAFCVVTDEYGSKELAEHVSIQYPHSCFGGVLRLSPQLTGGVRDLSNNAVVTLSLLTHTDRQALQRMFQYIRSHYGLPGWLGSRLVARCFTYLNRWIGPGQRNVTGIGRPWRTAHEIASSTISTVQWLPWVTPTAVQIKEMKDLYVFLSRDAVFRYSYAGHPDDGKDFGYYESATSQCIRFLGMLQLEQRSRLRLLVIREDRKCTALRCHAYGLIPFLKELPRLRVEHRIDMWSAIFLQIDAMHSWVNAARIPALAGRPTCDLSRATYKTIHWIDEAMDLRHAGMPSSAYRLYLEANVDTTQCVWNAIKSLAALALANQRSFHKFEDCSHTSTETGVKDLELDLGGSAPVFRERRFIRSVQLILSGDPTVRLSCPIGTLEELEEVADRMANELRDQPMDTWRRYAKNLVQGDLDTGDYDFTPLHELYHDPFLEQDQYWRRR